MRILNQNNSSSPQRRKRSRIFHKRMTLFNVYFLICMHTYFSGKKTYSIVEHDAAFPTRRHILQNIQDVFFDICDASYFYHTNRFLDVEMHSESKKMLFRAWFDPTRLHEQRRLVPGLRPPSESILYMFPFTHGMQAVYRRLL